MIALINFSKLEKDSIDSYEIVFALAFKFASAKQPLTNSKIDLF